MKELYFKQQLPIDLAQAWEFFSSPLNLKEITPAYMDFTVLSRHQGSKMYPGQIINYTVKPILGIPLQWTTEITQVVEQQYFIDEQRFGPYAFWHHQHRFTPIPGGTLMEDLLHYKIPFGPIGALVDRLYIHQQVQDIFAYRTKVLTERFGIL
ncbi:SRPBCC family protein [Dyadobacter tibetensis]|uniref:SRPBCC family protein n=1 Tax=Dyadobacter tibetensis TaxID=1211851 RepID=UPI000471FA7B|nr:SRPBCC family protein [Dyadobacter tibetensis]